MKRYITWGLAICSTLFLASCERYLDVEPKGKLIPTTVEDFRMLLDNAFVMNISGSLAELGADNLVLSDLQFNNLGSAYERNTYTWNKVIYGPVDQSADWNWPSKRIYYANLVLEGLEKDASGLLKDRNTVKGEALYHRGLALYEMVSMYAAAYDPATAATAPGIPLKLKSDVFIGSKRATMKESYDQLLADLTQAIELLPVRTTENTRAAKEAAYGMLARIYLDMGEYQKALLNAQEALKISDELLDYNDINPDDYPRFSRLNKEVIFQSSVPGEYTFMYFATVNPALYDLYEDDDLRKAYLFMAVPDENDELVISVDGSYGEWNWFSGVARDEIYLIAAECYARKNDLSAAKTLLNDLLINRMITGTFAAVTTNDPEELLSKILLERRKELAFRNRRWTDLKRLNKDPRFEVTLERTIKGTVYTLTPGSPRYVYPIPETVISATKMPQNER